MLRSSGARLAVLLILVMTLILVGLEIAHSAPALAVDGCRPTSGGIVCGYAGSSSSSSRSSRVRSPSNTPLPPLRYLATSGGTCWYWSRYRPGFDSWNSAYDQAIILTRWRLPRCVGRRRAPAVVVTVDATARAWTVFRSFPLDLPEFHLSPTVGITNLASRLNLDRPGAFHHAETLPDGRRLEVDAWVETIWIDWSDGTPESHHSLGTAVGNPGGVRHSYRLKTCSADYRIRHLDGPKCHPVHDRYPITVTLVWTGRYRTGGNWTRLGTIDRAASTRYDVDEVMGVLTG